MHLSRNLCNFLPIDINTFHTSELFINLNSVFAMVDNKPSISNDVAVQRTRHAQNTSFLLLFCSADDFPRILLLYIINKKYFNN